ncbi:MAG: TIGR03013 family PEP-CTERM/XrtA system glycosyltransferase [Acidobacteriota bacterium]|nr:MAG: TIGR03013 family PEP-CTERM/XrtA system glycosyltransferase [Acidobacteriota bacterium]
MENRNRKFGLVFVETLMVYLSGLAGLYLRFDEEVYQILTTELGWLKILYSTSVIVVTFYLFDMYDFQIVKQRSVLFTRIIQALGLATVILAISYFVLPDLRLGRGVFTATLMVTFLVILTWRVLANWLIWHPRLAHRILILGAEQNAIAIAREALDRRDHGYEVIGFLGNDRSLVGTRLLNPSIIGVMDDIERIVEEYEPDRIVVAMADRRGQLPMHLLLRFKVKNEILVEDADHFYERMTGKISTISLHPGQLVFGDTSRWRTFYRRIRRLIDIILSLVGLVLTAPLTVLTALAIRLESHGPIFYTQARVGLHGDIFRIIKFRSMRVDAEANGAVWASERDPRVTRVGAIIRKLRIDELPQFINVLKGEMSLIGPRPERPEFVSQLEQIIPFYSERHLVKPGLTGWAQVCYPYGASFDDAREKHQYDLYYIKNQSPWLDALILLETARVVLFGRLAR